MERRVSSRGNHIARRDVRDFAGMGLDVFSGERLLCGQCSESPGTMSFRSSFGTMHQIAFTDDANQLALVVHNGCGADPSFQKGLGDLLYTAR